MSHCPNCASLAKVIQQQQAKIATLEHIITSALGECAKVVSNSDKIHKGNQPRGTWSYAKGAKETAEIIAKKLR